MQVAILGTGLMGAAIGRRLLDQGHSLSVWNRTMSKAEVLGSKGASVASSPEGAVGNADFVILTLKDAGSIQDVLLQQAPLTQLEGTTVVQMSTISPDESREIAGEVEAAGGSYLEAPVLGSTPQAHEGKLIIMVAGEREVADASWPLLEELAEDPVYVGEIGKAATLKLALNQLLATHVASFSLSLGMILREEVPLDAFLEIVRNSSLHSPQFDKKLPRMLDRDFSDPHFPVSHMMKDIDLILAECGRLGLSVDALAGVGQIVGRALEMGFVEEDYSALYNAVNPPDNQ